LILPLFVPLFWSAAGMLVIVPAAIRLANRFKLVDVPYSAPHKTHNRLMPRAGGMALALVVGLVCLLGGAVGDPEVRAILTAAVVILAFGLVDDARGLSAPWKFLGQILASILLISQGVFIQMFRQPLIDLPLTFLWVVGITNAFNFVDSMDGLAVGLAGIASAFFLLVTLDAGQGGLAFLSVVMLGACIGMGYYNLQPARSFLGDSGAQLLGFLLAAIGIAYTPPGLPQPSSWFVPILLLCVPIFDTVLVVFSRLRRRVSVVQGGQDHTYHRLVRSGMEPSHAVASMHMAGILAGCLAFMALRLSPLWANAVFGAALLAGLGLLIWMRTWTAQTFQVLKAGEGERISWQCNICGRKNRSARTEFTREAQTCICGSNLRLRSVIHLLSQELLGKSLPLPDFPLRTDLKGIGLSDGVYPERLKMKLDYTNTFYDHEPRLDITATPDPAQAETLDFLISTEVFEHVAPPVSRAFENAYALLKPGGLLILTVPFVPEGATTEHFPDLHQYELVERGGSYILKNVTAVGEQQVFEDLVFHGGPGSTLEMRVFSRQGLMDELERAGFVSVHIASEAAPQYGIFWDNLWSLPIVARKP